jgi:hydrogenase large subunit
MATTFVVDPVTRIEGHLKVTVSIDTVGGTPQVVDAWSTGTLFRGFENVLLGRHPWDAPNITQRICGVCPASHSMAAVLALDHASLVPPPTNAMLLRNLVVAANFLDSHILHFYHLTLPDFVSGPAMPPWQPAWQSDLRIDQTATAQLVANYISALDVRRKAQEMGALFGGRMPHPPIYLPGGVTVTPRPERIAKCRQYVAEIQSFIDQTYLPDVETLASFYDDYYDIGRGHGNLLAFGVFGSGPDGYSSPLLGRGHLAQGATTPTSVNTRAIAEQVTYSWYDDTTQNLKPTEGVTTPQYPKTNAYSWLKAPRYDGRPCEVGPLARMMVNGDYTRGISAMDRHLARAQEAAKIASALSGWLDQLDSTKPVQTECTVPTAASGEGLTEAPRGALGHWLRIENSRIGGYQVVTPTCWNASPRDAAGVRGPLEEALVGTPVANPSEPVEVLRVVHSFDPCLACAVHVMQPGEVRGVKVLARS